MKSLFLATFLTALLGSCSVFAETADTLFHNGSIITMSGDEPAYAEAIAIKEGRIVFVGSKDEAWKWKGTTTTVVDLAGKALLPGFLDSHSHYINSLLVANQCMLYAPPSGPGKDVPSIIAELKKFALERKIPDGEMIMGYGYDDTVMPAGRLLNRDDLDEAFPHHPVRIDHVSMHGAVMNSLALKKYGISAETVTPAGGVIVRKPGTQEPWGLIMETAFLPVIEQAVAMTPQQEVDWTRAGQTLYAKAGVTTAHEGATHFPQVMTIKRASEAGANIIDVVAFPFITDVDKVLAEIPVTEWGKYHQRFKVGGVKITLDGSPQGRTAYFTTPYLTGGPSGEQNWTGEPTFPQRLANQMVKKVYDLQVPLILHCNGDAAIDAFLEAYESAREGDYSRPWNVTTIHTQFLRKDQIPKFVKYKIRPSFYTLHTFYFADAHLANRGQKQAAYISPMRDAIDAGLRPTNHTDFVVAPLDQMMMLWSAVNRVSRAGAEIGPDQLVTAYEGLKAMTDWAAQQYGEEDTKGTIAVGKLADLVILNQDPLKVPPMAIRDIQVIQTIKEGKIIYPDPEKSEPIATPGVDHSGGNHFWKFYACDMADVNQAARQLWKLTSLEGVAVQVAKPPTIQFMQGKLAIFGGVNRMSGPCALVGDQVVLGDLVSTRMAGPPELMDLEHRLANALSTVNAFHVQGRKLELLRDQQVVAVFTTD